MTEWTRTEIELVRWSNLPKNWILITANPYETCWVCIDGWPKYIDVHDTLPFR